MIIRLGKAFANVLIMAAITLIFMAVLFEVVFTNIDPLGFRTYHVDWRIMSNAAIAHESGWRLPEGVLAMTGYDATINADGTRYVPATATEADCTIAFVGDSMTFGMGVDDSDTWVNLLAAELPGVRFLNTGRPGYNTQDVLALMDAYPADGYVYLHTSNDNWVNDWPAWLAAPDENPFKPALYYYYKAIRGKIVGWIPETDEAMHRNAIADISTMDNVLWVAMDNDFLRGRIPDDALIIRWHARPISSGDAHPTPEGHQRMADDMMDSVKVFSERVC